MTPAAIFHSVLGSLLLVTRRASDRPSHPRSPLSSATPRRDPHGRGAFTLIELLIVIGIIAVLIALLLPAMRKARRAAQQVACMSNLRQLIIGTHQYVSDYKGYLPADYDNTSSATFWVSALYVYLPNSRVFLCPAESDLRCYWNGKQPLNYGADRFSYGINSWGQIKNSDLGMGTHAYSKGAIGPHKIGKVVLPSEFIAYGDSGGLYGPDGQWDEHIDIRPVGSSPVGTTYAYEWAYAWPTLRHPGRRALFAFLDGHVAPLSYDDLRDPRNLIYWNNDHRVH